MFSHGRACDLRDIEQGALILHSRFNRTLFNAIFYLYVFSDVFEGARSLETTFRSAAITMPSLARIPTHVPALLIASIAYSTFKNNHYDDEDINNKNDAVGYRCANTGVKGIW